MASKGIAIFIIPIVFSFVYGGVVLGSALQAPRAELGEIQLTSIEILGLQGQYSSADTTSVQVAIHDSGFDCGDLYITVFDISGGDQKAVKQGAFFDQCYGESGILPLNEKFSEKFESGEYSLEAQMFDKNGDKFLTARQTFGVQ